MSDGSSAGTECLRECAAADAGSWERRCLSGRVCGKREHTRASADLAVSRGEKDFAQVCVRLRG